MLRLGQHRCSQFVARQYSAIQLPDTGRIARTMQVKSESKWEAGAGGYLISTSKGKNTLQRHQWGRCN
jgi:hypothetical protein